MAVTKGQGNPSWNLDETILALDLYFRLDGRLPNKNDDSVRELSELLRSLPYHQDRPKNSRFRNTSAVRFKLQNLQSIVTGIGLDHVSRMDRRVVSEFEKRPEQLRSIASRIVNGAGELTASDFGGVDENEDDEFHEGQVIFVLHRKRERDPNLRKKFIERQQAGGLHCAICDLSKPGLKSPIQEAFFEVHHIVPLATAEKQRRTKLSDLALLCASCHRAIHKLISVEKRWISVEEAKDYFSQTSVSG